MVNRSLVLLVLALVLATLSTALAQSSRPDRDPASIQRKVQKSAELQRQALQSLADPGQAEQLVWKAYAELRAAQGDMIINASGAKFQDPLFDLNNKSAQQALSLLQQAGDTLKMSQRDRSVGAGSQEQGIGGQSSEAPTGSAAYLDTVRSALQQALRLTNSVVAY